MFLNFVLALTFVSSVLATEEAPGLRGAKVYRVEDIYAGQEASLKKQEQAVKALLENLTKIDPDVRPATAVGRHVTRETHSSLDYQGGNPELSFNGYMVNRRYSDGQCKGEPESVVALGLGCRPAPRWMESARSMDVVCGTTDDAGGEGGGGGNLLSRNQAQPALVSYFYDGPDCSGNELFTNTYPIPSSCSDGMKAQCVHHYNTPAFAKKDGLVTYKFNNVSDCMNFHGYYLQDWNVQTAWGSTVEFDDYLPSQDDDGEGGGNTPMSLSTDATAPAREHARSPVVEEEAPVQQAASTDVDKVESLLERQQRADRAARARIPEIQASAAAALAGTSAEHRLSLLNAWTGPYREYALLQRWNGICTYDDKYGLYVKTSCHGKVQKLSYYLFIDAECTRPIKRIVHDIYDAVPYYDQCVFSSTDERVALTVCHNTEDSSGYGGSSDCPGRSDCK